MAVVDKSKGRRESRAAATTSPVILIPSHRGIGDFERLLLFVRACGRCEFPGCNDYLLEHHLTLKAGNFAQMAHIVAFRPDGPRGREPLPTEYINDLSNLMVLCHKCHKQIDDRPDEYPVQNLRAAKAAHEDRIIHLTGIAPHLKTTIVQFVARIAGRATAIPFDHIAKAVEPRYPVDKKGVVVDLSAIAASGPDFVRLAQAEIAQKLAQLSTVGIDRQMTQHVSLFALGPIPLLVYLGRQLSDKVEVDLFQRHRDTEDWTWKTETPRAEYRFGKVRHGSDVTRVALVLSLSGKIDPNALAHEIDDRFTVYELTLGNEPPSLHFLKTRADLRNFPLAYQTALRTIDREHADLGELHLFPAVPAPIAVLCGRELLPKVDPKLLVYDADKANGGFTLITSVN